MAQSTKHEVFHATLRAWFPGPEFNVHTDYSLENMATRLRVVHLASTLMFDRMVDLEDAYSALYPNNLIRTILRSLSQQIHSELAGRGYGEPYTIAPGSRSALKALFQLMGIELLSRECQGEDGDEPDGRRLYMRRSGCWHRRISIAMLDRPLEWWQGFISGLVRTESSP